MANNKNQHVVRRQNKQQAGSACHDVVIVHVTSIGANAPRDQQAQRVTWRGTASGKRADSASARWRQRGTVCRRSG